jgi:signal transduction histidine kinase
VRLDAKFYFRRYWPAAAILVAGLLVSGLLGARFHRQAVAVDRARFQRTANDVIEALDNRVEKVEAVLRQGQDYLGIHEKITIPLYYDWSHKQAFADTEPWCYGLFLLTNRNASVWRATLPSDVSAWTSNDVETFSQFATKTPIKFDYCFLQGAYPQFEITHGYAWRWNYREVTNDFSDVDGCLAGNLPRTTGRQQIAVEYNSHKPHFGAALVFPLFAADLEALTGALAYSKPNLGKHRVLWNACRGILVAPIEYGVMEADLWNSIPQEVAIEIFASSEPSKETWLNPKAETPRALDPQFKPYMSETVLWKMYGRKWAVFVYTLPLFEKASPRPLASLTMAAGAGMTLLASALVGVALRARARQEGLTLEITEARDALAAAERVREQLGHDLHDGAIQSLYAIQLKLGRRVQDPGATSETVSCELAAARAELDAVISEMRRFIVVEEKNRNLADLGSVLQVIANRASTGEGPHIELHCDPEAAKRVSPSQAVQIANIAREALSNAARHANANQVKFTLTGQNESICMEIADDGIGFEVEAVAGQGVGLTSMARRAVELGGKLEIDSRPGKGTKVRLSLPASQLRGMEA